MVLNLINFIQVAIVWILIIPDLIFSIHRESREVKKNDAASITEQFGRYASMLLMVLPLGIWEFGFKSPEEMIISEQNLNKFRLVTEKAFPFAAKDSRIRHPSKTVFASICAEKKIRIFTKKNTTIILQ